MTENPIQHSQQGLTPQENDAIIAGLVAQQVAAQEQKLSRRVLLYQVVAALLSALLAFLVKSEQQFALAVFCGGMASALNGFMTAWRMSRSTSQSAQDVNVQLRLLYFYAAERFLAVVVMLAVCMLVLKLSAPAVLGGFAVVQVVMMTARLINKFKITLDSGVKNVQ